jgi:NADH-quinone oxidoreductase subunit C/D
MHDHPRGIDVETGLEMCRIAAHLLAVGTFALDIYGDFTAIFMYAITDREKVQNLLEDLTGQRLMFNYLRLGGTAWDLPEPREEYFEKVREFCEYIPERLEEYHNPLSSNELFQMRVMDTGILPPEEAKSYGCTGPVARGSGIDYDLRRDDPYGYYPEVDFDVITDDGCDNFSRALVRLEEMRQSARIIEQCVDALEEYPEEEREIQANVPRTLKPEPDTEIYKALEAAKGEPGTYMRADGTVKPARLKPRSPPFSNLH